MTERNQIFRNQNTIEHVHKALISLQDDGKMVATNADIDQVVVPLPNCP